MRILLTNDDGIAAAGLKTIETIARAFRPEAEIWTVAPAFEQSGVGHCISYTSPVQISKLDAQRFAVEGSPADCVLAALHHVLPAKPDLILSGVNRGNNSAENAMYSGTLGAAMEGALQGIPSIALSQYFGPQNAALDDPFDAAAQHGAALVEKLMQANLWGGLEYQLFYNVNFPPLAAADVAGMRATAQGYRGHGRMGMTPHTAPSGRSFLYTKGSPQHDPTGPGSDARANLSGYISVTPMRADLTDRDALARLAGQLE